MIFVKIRGSSKKYDPPVGGFFFSGMRSYKEPTTKGQLPKARKRGKLKVKRKIAMRG